MLVAFAFTRAPFGEVDAPPSAHMPHLICEVENGYVYLSLCGLDSHGLSAALHRIVGDDAAASFEGQHTYDQLKSVYKAQVGSVYVHVILQQTPALGLELTDQGWVVLDFGGAERFEGLAERLRSAGYEAHETTGRSNTPAVVFQIPEGQELQEFDRLAPIIMNS